MSIVNETNLPLPLLSRGKVRDAYDLGERLLFIATDRISAFDFVLPNGIPEKGLVLNQISAFWFKKTEHLLPNHLIKTIDNLKSLQNIAGASAKLPEYLIGRSMIVKKAKRLPVEAVVRGYLSGSSWEEYKNKGTISGIRQVAGMRESQKFPEPIFTPTTKADSGHDLPLSKKELIDILGKETSDMIESKSVAIYNYAWSYANKKGIIIADTKFEFGYQEDVLLLIDEVLTPDSSRFWDAKQYAVGRSQPSFDKQPVRDYLVMSGWNKKPPVPQLPDDVIAETTERYKTAYKMIVGKPVKSVG